MSKIPLPQPLTDEEEAAHERAAYEAQVSLAWQDALEWAEKGNRQSLVAMLRGEAQLSERDVLDFLAAIVEGKFKWPRKRPPQRPTYTWALDRNDSIVWVDGRDAPVLELQKWIRDNKAAHGNDIYRAAAKRFGLSAKNAENLDTRSMKARRRKRST